MSYSQSEILEINKNEVLSVIAIVMAIISSALMTSPDQIGFITFDTTHVGFMSLVGSALLLMWALSSQAQG
jgi:hypothetical protein